MISASISRDGSVSPTEEYVERLFLPNSRDLVQLLVDYNMSQFHPQLKGCAYTLAVSAGMAVG